MSAKKILSDIIDCDTRIAKLRDEFDGCDGAEQLRVLEEVLGEQLKSIGEDGEITIAFLRAADMLVPLGTRGVGALARGFGHANPDVRNVVGESLFAIAEEEGGLAGIRPAIDSALKAGGPSAKEMPWLLAELEDEDAPKAIAEFLKSGDAEVVAEAIEALADFGDPASVPALEALLKDKRPVRIEGDDEGDGIQEWTIGELARQAIEMIEEGEE